MKPNKSPIDSTMLQDVIRLLYPCMDDYLYLFDLQNDSFYISPSALDRFALPAHEFHNVLEGLCLVVLEEDQEVLFSDIEGIMAGDHTFHNLQYRWYGRDGRPIWINCRGQLIFDHQEKPLYLFGCINEIGAKQKADNVSGLLGVSSLETLLSGLAGSKQSGYLMRIGIDGFKDINENLGVEYGDYVLQSVGRCIADNAGENQSFFRAVADEYILVDTAGGGAPQAEALYKRIRQSVDRQIEKEHYEAVYTISAGILAFQGDLPSYSDFMRYSEFALNQAKRGGRNSSYLFNGEDYARYTRQKEITRVLRYSVYHDFEGFEVYYQPIVNTLNYELAGVETLLRFSHPDFGSIPPSEFIPLLEETGLIIPVGKWILKEALFTCSSWQRRIPGFRVSVNLSYVQFMKSSIITDIINYVNSYHLTPSSLIIELTESGVFDSTPHFRKLWKKLQEKGVLLALDDFGTGYSNLHCLYDLSPDIVKIDRSFTLKALDNDYEHTLLTRIVEMVHSINLKLCVEGIETAEQMRQIRSMKPDYIQGYLFGRPCPKDVFEANYIGPHKEQVTF